VKVRKRPVTVEAEQWFPGKVVAGVDVCTPANMPSGVTLLSEKMVNGEYGVIQTLEGPHLVTCGDWIITGVMGEKYACKPEVFRLTYEVIE
jgi:hypothetical protein